MCRHVLKPGSVLDSNLNDQTVILKMCFFLSASLMDGGYILADTGETSLWSLVMFD